MRLKMYLNLENVNYDNSIKDLRYFKNYNSRELAPLFLSAYHGSVDDEGETLQDWEEIIEDIKADKFGERIDDASFVIHENGELTSGIVIGLEDDYPYIISLVTLPSCQRQGLATKLTLLASKVLKEKYKKLVLYVNENNKNAITLYTKLRFISERLGDKLNL